MIFPPTTLRSPASCRATDQAEARVVLALGGTRMTCRTGEGELISGVDFTSQDSLGLAGHPALRAVALAALRDRNSARGQWIAPPGGLTEPLLALEARVADFLRAGQATVFPSGSEANRGALRALLRRGDHLIVDADAHPALAEVARGIGAGVHRSPPGSLEAVERRLRRLRRAHPGAVIVVAVSAIAAMTAVRADLPALIDLCREGRALLLADVSHDLGAMGATGRGVMELEGCLGRVDVVTASFGKCFGAAGGLVASRDPGLKGALARGGRGQTAALPAVQAGLILQAFDLVDSTAGAERRLRLMGNVQRLRNRLEGDCWPVPGREAPFVPVRLPKEAAVGMSRAADRAGYLLDLLCAPLVAGHAPRWRIHLRADHTLAEIDSLAATLSQLRGLQMPPRRPAAVAQPA